MDIAAKQLFDQCRSELSTHYSHPEAQSIAFMLLEYAFGFDKTQVLVNKNAQVDTTTWQKYEDALKRLQQQEPIQYIIGQTEFYGLPFKVQTGVLIPRPETEELVDWIIQNHPPQPLHLLDIGTGSGCIAVTLAKHLPQAQVSALDVSPQALSIAQQNAELNQVNIRFIQENILAPSALDVADQSLDVVVSNPPYVTPAEKAQMHTNVLAHEPELALFVPQDEPLLFYEAIAQFAQQKLKPKGALYFEINELFGQATQAMMEQKGFTNVEIKKDMFGKDRMAVGWLA